MGIIRVKGTGALNLQPDYVNVSIDVKTKVYKLLNEANDAALSAIQAIKNICAAHNIDSKEIKVVSFTHHNIYKTVETEKDPFWSQNKETTRKQVFDGYQSTARVFFGFDFNMGVVAEMFEKLSAVQDITYRMNYGMKENDKYEKEVKALAVKNAIETANILAAAANVSVKEIVEISYGSEYHGGYRRGVEMETMMLKSCSMRETLEDMGVSDINFSDTVELVVNVG